MSERLDSPVAARDHVQGRADAPVGLLEYGDYECSHCGRAHHVVQAVQRHIGAPLRFVFRNFPLRAIHPHAELAARAAEAAAGQGKFWEMHERLFENQRALAPQHLRLHARELGLDVALWERDLDAQVTSNRVQEDIQSGERSGVVGTPTFFISGWLYKGPVDERGLIAAIEAALRTHRKGANHELGA